LIWTRIFETPHDTLLAAADEELVGKEFRDKKFRLKVSESFYKDVLVSEETMGELLVLCSVANLVGERCVGKAVELGLVSEDNILYIDGVPHAQFSLLE
jgi:hypothetical protein